MNGVPEERLHRSSILPRYLLTAQAATHVRMYNTTILYPPDGKCNALGHEISVSETLHVSQGRKPGT
jgi:hypothetical protein